jgi:hypothetical protein
VADLRGLQNRFRNATYLIIDEKSMVDFTTVLGISIIDELRAIFPDKNMLTVWRLKRGHWWLRAIIGNYNLELCQWFLQRTAL